MPPPAPAQTPVYLRRTQPSDLPVLYEMQTDPESNRMAGTKPRTREVFFSVWAGHFENPLLNTRVIEVDGPSGRHVVGGISCFQADGHDCVGYWIARDHWGKAIASRALTMFLLEEPRRPLHATAATTNAVSHRILEKNGFRRTGTRMGEETDRFLAREIADYVLE